MTVIEWVLSLEFFLNLKIPFLFIYLFILSSGCIKIEILIIFIDIFFFFNKKNSKLFLKTLKKKKIQDENRTYLHKP